MNDREHSPQTPNELYDAYESAAKLLPRPWRWWYAFKARQARQAWDTRRDQELAQAIRSEKDEA